MSADDAAARDRRQHVHMAQDVGFGEPREDPDVIERCAKAAARERQPDLAESRNSSHLEATQCYAAGLMLSSNDIDHLRGGVPIRVELSGGGGHRFV